MYLIRFESFHSIASVIFVILKVQVPQTRWHLTNGIRRGYPCPVDTFLAHTKLFVLTIILSVKHSFSAI